MSGFWCLVDLILFFIRFIGLFMGLVVILNVNYNRYVMLSIFSILYSMGNMLNSVLMFSSVFIIRFVILIIIFSMCGSECL